MRIHGLQIVLVLACSAAAEAQSTTRASVSSAGDQGTGHSSPFITPSISADGRHVAFVSWATNLVPGDTNGVSDVFVHDRQTGQTARVNVSPSGAQVAAEATRPAISADGRYVAFESGSEEIVPGDVNNQQDVFVYDRVTGMTALASVTSTGAQPNNGCGYASISSDGRYVCFQTSATNMVPGDTNGLADIFVRDRVLGVTKRVSVSTAGAQVNFEAVSPRMSADGLVISFASAASTLVAGDTNGTWDIFVHDQSTGETTRASVGSGGVEANGGTLDWAPLSDDGRFIVFESQATNLVSGDTNSQSDVFIRDRVAGETTRVSLSSSGTQAGNASFSPSVSGDGRIVAFFSYANDLVPNDTNGEPDVFVRDRLTGMTTRESVSTAGGQGNDDAGTPGISGNGRFVAFPSPASNLVTGDTNNAWDVFVRDRLAVITGDIDGDGKVNGADVAILLGAWGPCAGCLADLNGDGVVDGGDMAILLGNWTG